MLADCDAVLICVPTPLANQREPDLSYSSTTSWPARHTIRTTPKIVGGLTEACRDRAVEVYSEICDEVVSVTTPEAAELTKLLENVWEVIDAAATKPFGFMRFEPGPGMGGHCLPIDPFYLAFKARQHDLANEFIELAGKDNQQQPHFCVARIVRALNDVRKPARGSRVLLLGVSYKSGIGDMRQSPALKIAGRSRSWGSR